MTAVLPLGTNIPLVAFGVVLAVIVSAVVGLVLTLRSDRSLGSAGRPADRRTMFHDGGTGARRGSRVVDTRLDGLSHHGGGGSGSYDVGGGDWGDGGDGGGDGG